MEIEGIIFSLVCFSTVIWMITWGVRHLTEIIFPSWADKNTVFEKIWAGVILPTLPGLLGAVGALFPYPFPSPMDEGYAKIVCGIFCGLVSLFIFCFKAYSLPFLLVCGHLIFLEQELNSR